MLPSRTSNITSKNRLTSLRAAVRIARFATVMNHAAPTRPHTHTHTHTHKHTHTHAHSGNGTINDMAPLYHERPCPVCHKAGARAGQSTPQSKMLKSNALLNIYHLKVTVIAAGSPQARGPSCPGGHAPPVLPPSGSWSWSWSWGFASVCQAPPPSVAVSLEASRWASRAKRSPSHSGVAHS